MTLDPVLVWIIRIALGLLFGVAAWHKLSDGRRFAATLERYRLLPAWAVRPAAVGLPVLELGIALGLWLDFTANAAAAAAMSLLGLYTLAMVVNLRRGRRDLDCGCLGPSRKTPVHGGLVARNLALMGAAVAAALPMGQRALGWVDFATLGCALIVIGLLWSAAQQLTANALPRGGDLG